MISERKLAYLLAKEVSYRVSKKYHSGRRSFLGSPRPQPSVLRSNAVPAIMYLFLSTFFSLPLFFLIGKYSLDIIYVSIMAFVLFIGSLMALFHSVTFTSTFISEKIVSFLLLLPFDEKKLMKTYFLSLFLYWGGLAVFLMLTPPILMGLYGVAMGNLPPIIPFLGLIAGFLTYSMVFLLGIGLGSYSQLVKKHGFLRFFSTIMWLAAFFSLYFLNQIFKMFFLPLTKSTGIVAYIPIFGILVAYAHPLKSLVSLTLSTLLLFISYKFAISRISLLFSLTPFKLPTVPFLEFERKDEIKIRGGFLGLILKDVKLLSREPRRLANLLYPVILVFIWIVFRPTSLGWGGMLPQFLLAFANLAGFMVGTITDVLYFIEGEYARIYYFLPLSKKKIALSKTGIPIILSFLTGISIFVAVFMAIGSVEIAVQAFLLSTFSGVFLSIMCSAFTIRNLPETPSAWTEAIEGRTTIVLLKIILMFLFAGIGFVLFIGAGHIIGLSIITLIMLFLYCSIGIITLVLMPKEPFGAKTFKYFKLYHSVSENNK